MLSIGVPAAILALLSLRSGEERLIRCTWAVALNWVLNTAAGALIDKHLHWVVWGSVDLWTAAWVLWGHSGRFQAALATTYALQLIMHAAFGMGAQDQYAEAAYWGQLYNVAVAQLLLLTVWCIHEGVGRRLPSVRGLFRHRFGLAGMAPFVPAGALGDGMDRSRFRERVAGSDRAVRFAGVQLPAASGAAPVGPAQVGSGGGDAQRPDNIVGSPDGRGDSGAGDSDACGSCGNRPFSLGIPGIEPGDEAVIRHWLAEWLKLRQNSSSRFNEHVSRIEEAAANLAATAQEMRNQRDAHVTSEEELAAALEQISKRLIA